MNFVERIAKWVGVDVTAANRPEVVNFRATMEVARAAKRAEDYHESLAAFDRAATLADEIGDVMSLSVIRLHRADILTRLGKFEDAQTLIEMVLNDGDGMFPTAPRAYAKVAKGVMQIAQGEFEAARVTLEDARSTATKAKSPGAEGRALGYLAGTYLHEGNASYATHLLREALPKLNMAGDLELSALFIGQLGNALAASGDTAEADTLYSRGLRLAEQMNARGDLRRINMALAKRALEMGRYAESYNHYEKALQYTDEDAPERATALRDVATACLYLDKGQDALVYAERAYALQPDNAAIRGTLGVILQSVGRPADALPHLQAAMNPAAPDYDTYRALAAAQVDAGETTGGLTTLEAALDLARKADMPLEAARTLRDIGHIHAREQRLAEAIKAWTSALELYESQNVYAQAARLLCDIATARLQTGQTVRAYRDYEQALMLINSVDDLATRGVVLSNAATVYIERGDLETAEAFFTEAIQIAQKTHDTTAEATRRGNFGWFLLNTGRYERAKTALQLALELSERLGLKLPTAVQTSNLAQTASALGDNDAAEKLHLRAIEMADGLDLPQWRSTIRTNYAQWLASVGRVEEARSHLTDALAMAQTAHNNEALWRATIELAKLDGRADPVKAAADVLAVVNAVRGQGNRRLLADALTALSQLTAAQNRLEDANRLWDEAHKLYSALDHPSKRLEPAWLYPTDSEGSRP
jgi:tetratricopeptide (TPR) repeat protein